MTHLGIDARAAAEEPAGRGRYVRELLRALARRDDDHVYELYAREAWAEDLDERFRWRLIRVSDPVWHLRVARTASSACSAFLSTNSYLTAWFLRVPGVVVVHDLIPFVRGVATRRSSKLIEHATIGLGVRRAARIVCDSDSTRTDLLERYPRLAGRAVTVPLGVDEDFRRRRTPDELASARRRHNLDGPFVLSVGTLEPRKNLERAVEAFGSLPSDLLRETRLALVGLRGWDFEPILERARLQADRVTLLDRVSDEDLGALYQTCDAFVFPSLYEGFGLPLLEALAAGAPAIASNVSSLPEVGGDAVVYVDPLETSQIRGALEKVLSSPEKRDRLRALGPKQAAKFSWARTAKGVLDQLGEAASRS